MTDQQASPVRRRWRGFDLTEVLLAAAFTGLAVWVAGIRRDPPHVPDQFMVDVLEEKYGPSRSSGNYEEWIIRDFFKDRRGGFFLDVGANHYRRNNNTYYLEVGLGWSGIAIEPLTKYEGEYRHFRPRTRFRGFFVSDVSNTTARLYTLADGRDLVTSGDKSFTERFGPETKELTAPTITLDDLLATEGVEKVDFMSMDIELYEPKALAGFDIQRFRPDLACVEAHHEVRQAIIDYFVARGYTIVGDYLRIDAENLYFAPLGSAQRR